MCCVERACGEPLDRRGGLRGDLDADIEEHNLDDPRVSKSYDAQLFAESSFCAPKTVMFFLTPVDKNFKPIEGARAIEAPDIFIF